jgi:hypothetical protein
VKAVLRKFMETNSLTSALAEYTTLPGIQKFQAQLMASLTASLAGQGFSVGTLENARFTDSEGASKLRILFKVFNASDADGAADFGGAVLIRTKLSADKQRAWTRVVIQLDRLSDRFLLLNHLLLESAEVFVDAERTLPADLLKAFQAKLASMPVGWLETVTSKFAELASSELSC